MLDEANLQPFQGTFNPNQPEDYAAARTPSTRDITIPADATSATLTLRLYLNSSAAFTPTRSAGTRRA